MNIGDIVNGVSESNKQIDDNRTDGGLVSKTEPLSQANITTIGSIIDPAYRNNESAAVNASPVGFGTVFLRIIVFIFALNLVVGIVIGFSSVLFKKKNTNYYQKPSISIVQSPQSAQVPPVTSSTSTTENVLSAKVTEVHGPGINVMSCSKPAAFNLPFGKVACYGIWDYGNEFGGDPDMCQSGDGSGCRVKTLACESGTAVTMKKTSPKNMSINSSELMLYSSNLGAPQEAVKQNIITLWEYTCN